jgi:predicted PilT family ATPase
MDYQNEPHELMDGFTRQSLPIPEYKMGWIIGKRGTYIAQLSKKSGATITISDSVQKEYGTIWKNVILSGSEQSVERAKKLFHIRLERFVARENTDLLSINENVVIEIENLVDSQLKSSIGLTNSLLL